MSILNFEELLREALIALNEIPNKKINGSNIVSSTYELASLIDKTLGNGTHKKKVVAVYYSVDDILDQKPELTPDQAADLLAEMIPVKYEVDAKVLHDKPSQVVIF